MSIIETQMRRTLATAALSVLFVTATVFEPVHSQSNGSVAYTVPNQAMTPALRIRSLVQLDKEAYQHTKIERGDIVIFQSEKHDGLLLPSRAVGLPGETIELLSGKLIVNGKFVPEPYMESDSAERPFSKEFSPIRIPEDSVFLMGDLRDLSEDSRSIGPVSTKLIVGRVHI